MLEFVLFLKVLQIIFKAIILKGVFVFTLEAVHFHFAFILFFVCSCFRFFLFPEAIFFFVLASRELT